MFYHSSRKATDMPAEKWTSVKMSPGKISWGKKNSLPLAKTSTSSNMRGHCPQNAEAVPEIWLLEGSCEKASNFIYGLLLHDDKNEIIIWWRKGFVCGPMGMHKHRRELFCKNWVVWLIKIFFPLPEMGTVAPLLDIGCIQEYREHKIVIYNWFLMFYNSQRTKQQGPYSPCDYIRLHCDWRYI